MALKQYCANESCPKHTVASGGRFIYSREQSKFFCEDCFHIPAVLNSAKNLWDFTTTHLDGNPIHVRSLEHMRQLEKQFGVSNHAANHMESQWNSPPPIKRHESERNF